MRNEVRKIALNVMDRAWKRPQITEDTAETERGIKVLLFNIEVINICLQHYLECLVNKFTQKSLLWADYLLSLIFAYKSLKKARLLTLGLTLTRKSFESHNRISTPESC